MKTKKIIACLLAILMVMQSFYTLNIFAAELPTIEVSQESGHIGETVDITVSLSNNPGIVSMSLTVNYDNAIKLTAVNDTGLLPGKVHKPSLSNPYYLTWANDTAIENYAVNGNLVTLTFEITDKAKDGEKYPVSVYYDVDNYDVYDVDMNCIEFELVAGYVEVISEHTHNYVLKIKNDATRKASATCTSDAEYFYSCECGEISSTETFFDDGSRLDHTGGTATCVAKAVCDICKTAYGEFDSNNHVNTTVINSKTATCTVPGYTGDTYCNDCKNIIEYGEDIPATNHKWDNGTVTAPTCLTEGYTIYTCTVAGCGATKTENIVPATGHKGGIATCVSKAICDTCKIAYGELDPDNHEKVVIDEAVPATCTSTGLTEGSHCDACGTTIVEQEKTDKLPHTLVSAENGKAATCLEDGKEADTICSVCKETLKEGKVLPKTGHTGGTATCVSKAICDTCKTAYGELDPDNHEKVVIDEAVPATCTSTGLTEGSHCDACGTTIIKQEETKMLPHTDKTINAKEATCKEEGYTGDVICSVCGEIISTGTMIDKLPHTVKTVGAKEATCKEAGYTGDVICSVCGETISTGTTIDKLAHKPVSADNAIPATCETDGKESDIICDACGDTIETGKIILALEHKWSVVSTKEATCLVDGAIEYVCDNDASHTKTEVIKAQGHKDDDADDVCDVCGQQLGECKHTSISVVNAKEATCTETGYSGDRVCDICGETVELGSETDILEHTVVTDSAVAATCTNDGLTEGKHCSVCGTVIAKQTIVVATGHSYGKWQTVEKPTCSTNGLDVRTCTVCGCEQSETIPMTGFVDDDEDGLCDECGVSEEEHPTAGIYGIIYSVKRFVFIILSILEIVFTALNAASVGNGPYRELLAVVKALQKSFGFVS